VYPKLIKQIEREEKDQEFLDSDEDEDIPKGYVVKPNEITTKINDLASGYVKRAADDDEGLWQLLTDNY